MEPEAGSESIVVAEAAPGSNSIVVAEATPGSMSIVAVDAASGSQPQAPKENCITLVAAQKKHCIALFNKVHELGKLVEENKRELDRHKYLCQFPLYLNIELCGETVEENDLHSKLIDQLHELNQTCKLFRTAYKESAAELDEAEKLGSLHISDLVYKLEGDRAVLLEKRLKMRPGIDDATFKKMMLDLIIEEVDVALAEEVVNEAKCKVEFHLMAYREAYNNLFKTSKLLAANEVERDVILKEWDKEFQKSTELVSSLTVLIDGYLKNLKAAMADLAKQPLLYVSSDEDMDLLRKLKLRHYWKNGLLIFTDPDYKSTPGVRGQSKDFLNAVMEEGFFVNTVDMDNWEKTFQEEEEAKRWVQEEEEEEAERWVQEGSTRLGQAIRCVRKRKL